MRRYYVFISCLWPVDWAISVMSSTSHQRNSHGGRDLEKNVVRALMRRQQQLETVSASVEKLVGEVKDEMENEDDFDPDEDQPAFIETWDMRTLKKKKEKKQTKRAEEKENDYDVAGMTANGEEYWHARIVSWHEHCPSAASTAVVEAAAACENQRGKPVYIEVDEAWRRYQEAVPSCEPCIQKYRFCRAKKCKQAIKKKKAYCEESRSENACLRELVQCEDDSFCTGSKCDGTRSYFDLWVEAIQKCVEEEEPQKPSTPQCKFGDWDQWSDCVPDGTSLCGRGTRTRHRDGCSATGELEDGVGEERCNKDCPTEAPTAPPPAAVRTAPRSARSSGDAEDQEVERLLASLNNGAARTWLRMSAALCTLVLALTMS